MKTIKSVVQRSTFNVQRLKAISAVIPAKAGIQLLVVVCALVFTGCGGGGVISEPKDGPPPKDIDVSHIPDAVPRWEPITKAGNKSPYTVLGKTYRVMPASTGYREQGLASWYGNKFHGRKTSNGENYSMYAMTAAHKTLPIPTYVQVTNLENGRRIIVRVNDRGPFHKGRIIDLSYAAAKKLGYASKGTARVEVVAIDPAHYQRNTVEAPQVPESEQPVPPAIISGDAFLQVGAFNSPASAESLRQRIRRHTHYPISVRPVNQGSSRLYKVWIGPIVDKLALDSLKQLLQQRENLAPFVVSE